MGDRTRFAELVIRSCSCSQSPRFQTTPKRVPHQAKQREIAETFKQEPRSVGLRRMKSQLVRRLRLGQAIEVDPGSGKFEDRRPLLELSQ